MLILPVTCPSTYYDLLYLCADTDEEAFHVSGDVPVRDVLRASSAVCYWLGHPECPWTRRSVRRIEQLKASAYVYHSAMDMDLYT